MIKEIKGAISSCLSLYYRILRPGFTFQGRAYRYYFHKHNKTWRNERAVELPIVLGMVKENGGRMLEVGNVLSHYVTMNHDVVDKYERADGVINEDIVGYSPKKKYDLVVCISTLEHIGFSPPEELEPAKPARAVESMKKMLAKNGKMVITFPPGYNPHLDGLVDSGKIRFSEMHCFKRTSFLNTWKEAEWSEVRQKRGLAIGVVA